MNFLTTLQKRTKVDDIGLWIANASIAILVCVGFYKGSLVLLSQGEVIEIRNERKEEEESEAYDNYMRMIIGPRATPTGVESRTDECYVVVPYSEFRFN